MNITEKSLFMPQSIEQTRLWFQFTTTKLEANKQDVYKAILFVDFR